MVVSQSVPEYRTAQDDGVPRHVWPDASAEWMHTVQSQGERDRQMKQDRERFGTALG